MNLETSASSPAPYLSAKELVSANVSEDMEILFPPSPFALLIPVPPLRPHAGSSSSVFFPGQPSSPVICFCPFEKLIGQKQITSLQQVLQSSWGPGGQLQEGHGKSGQCRECQISLLSLEEAAATVRPPPGPWSSNPQKPGPHSFPYNLGKLMKKKCFPGREDSMAVLSGAQEVPRSCSSLSNHCHQPQRTLPPVLYSRPQALLHSLLRLVSQDTEAHTDSVSCLVAPQSHLSPLTFSTHHLDRKSVV